jgi:hypothetical protein
MAQKSESLKGAIGVGVPKKTGARGAGEDFGGRGSRISGSAHSATSTPVLPLNSITCIVPGGFGAII